MVTKSFPHIFLAHALSMFCFLLVSGGSYSFDGFSTALQLQASPIVIFILETLYFFALLSLLPALSALAILKGRNAAGVGDTKSWVATTIIATVMASMVQFGVAMFLYGDIGLSTAMDQQPESFSRGYLAILLPLQILTNIGIVSLTGRRYV